MDKETAVRMWREIGAGLPGGGATERLIDAFATAVEAAERERGAAEVHRLRAALVPMANASFSHERAEITAADCERARLALYGPGA